MSYITFCRTVLGFNPDMIANLEANCASIYDAEVGAYLYKWGVKKESDMASQINELTCTYEPRKKGRPSSSAAEVEKEPVKEPDVSKQKTKTKKPKRAKTLATEEADEHEEDDSDVHVEKSKAATKKIKQEPSESDDESGEPRQKTKKTKKHESDSSSTSESSEVDGIDDSKLTRAERKAKKKARELKHLKKHAAKAKKAKGVKDRAQKALKKAAPGILASLAGPLNKLETALGTRMTVSLQTNISNAIFKKANSCKSELLRYKKAYEGVNTGEELPKTVDHKNIKEFIKDSTKTANDFEAMLTLLEVNLSEGV